MTVESLCFFTFFVEWFEHKKESRQRCHFDVFIVAFEHICICVSIVNFVQVIVSKKVCIYDIALLHISVIQVLNAVFI